MAGAYKGSGATGRRFFGVWALEFGLCRRSRSGAANPKAPKGPNAKNSEIRKQGWLRPGPHGGWIKARGTSLLADELCLAQAALVGVTAERFTPDGRYDGFGVGLTSAFGIYLAFDPCDLGFAGSAGSGGCRNDQSTYQKTPTQMPLSATLKVG